MDEDRASRASHLPPRVIVSILMEVGRVVTSWPRFPLTEEIFILAATFCFLPSLVPQTHTRNPPQPFV